MRKYVSPLALDALVNAGFWLTKAAVGVMTPPYGVKLTPSVLECSCSEAGPLRPASRLTSNEKPRLL